MKISGFWVLFSMVGVALLMFAVSSNAGMERMIHVHRGESMTLTRRNRKLKADGDNINGNKRRILGHFDLNDYHPIDPVPSSKASIKPGPIEHGTPVIPYIPKPSPPDHPRYGGLT